MTTTRRDQRAPLWLGGSVFVVGALLSVPLVEVVRQAITAGHDTIHRVVSGPLLATLLANTIKLTVIVTAACGVLGLATAWLVERTDLPARNVFAVVLLLPLAVPDDVAGYAWVSLAPSIQGLWGAALVMTLVLYPLVYLPVAATLRRCDPALDEVAQSLGVGPIRRFLRVTLPGVQRPLLGGMLLVSLYLFGEYGAFAVLRYRTFATAIYTQYEVGFDAKAASVLTLVICIMGAILLIGESTVGRAHPGRESGRPPTRAQLGAAAPVAAVGLLALCGLGIGVPVYSIVYWMVRGTSTTLPPASVLGTTLHTLFLGAIAAGVATLLALPVAVLGVRRRGRLAGTVERVAYLNRALPAIAVALILIPLGIHHLRPLYQTTAMLEIAYVILFFPLALVAVTAAVARVPPAFDEAARSLGASPLKVLRRITLPLVVPGLAAAAVLVWLSATTELTATLLLRPTGSETLATQFWAYLTGLAYGAAAPYGAIMIATSLLPLVLLTRMARRVPSAANQIPRR